MKSWTLLPLGFLLAGCINDEPNPPPYPPLDARALVGCWQRNFYQDRCEIRCFNREGGYFLTRTFLDRKIEVREDSGSYAVSKNTLSLNRTVKTTLGVISQSDDGLSLTIINDTLMGTEPLRGYSLARVSPDSFPCGLKPWTLFQKPAGWDSLIKPY